MEYQQTYKVNKSKQLVIDLPEGFHNKKQVKVIIQDAGLSRTSKIAMLKNATKDPHFTDDSNEVASDFEGASY